MSETREQRIERLYAQAEHKLEGDRARSVARGPITLVAVLVALSLAVGVTAAIDLRRLDTPLGTALGWTGAAVYGDCEAYQRLSEADPAGAAEARSDADVCRDLRALTTDAREMPASIDIRADAGPVRGDVAEVPVTVTRPGRERRVVLPLQRRDGDWRVVRTAEVCRVVGCP
jgi:hypothetical protein